MILLSKKGKILKKFPRVLLPIDFIHLLKMNIHSKTDLSTQVIHYIEKQTAFSHFIEQRFIEFDKERRPLKIILSLGWENFRDRLAGLYIEYATYRSYPKKTTPKKAAEISLFAKRMQRYTVEGYSRGFLLGLYLQFLKLQLYKEDPTSDFKEFIFNDEFFKLMDTMSAKVVDIDWLVLAIMHFKAFLPFERVEGILKEGDESFEQLFGILTPDQKETFTHNMLFYGMAINEESFFVHEEV